MTDDLDAFGFPIVPTGNNYNKKKDTQVLFEKIAKIKEKKQEENKRENAVFMDKNKKTRDIQTNLETSLRKIREADKDSERIVQNIAKKYQEMPKPIKKKTILARISRFFSRKNKNNGGRKTKRKNRKNK